MSTKPKKVDTLTIDDIGAFPVWKFVNDDQLGELAVLPVKRLPVKSLTGKLVGTQVQMANGNLLWALIGNVDESDGERNGHFLTISVERDGQWFLMARYHDIDYNERGPKRLAKFLGLEVKQIFPILFDLRPYIEGEASALLSHIPEEPHKRLSCDELIALAIR